MAINAAENAYRTLRKMIVSLELRPGASFGEVQACDLLGSSRTPIREAFNRLSQEGLIDSRGRSGTIIKPISREAVKTAQFLRECVETQTIKRAAKGRDKLFSLRAAQSLEEQKFAIAENDQDLFFSSDEKLHQEFCRAAGMPNAWPFIAESKTHLDRLRRLSLETTDFQRLLHEHRGLVEAVETRNERQAEKLMKTHLSRVLDEFDDLAQRNPDYFAREDGTERGETREVL